MCVCVCARARVLVCVLVSAVSTLHAFGILGWILDTDLGQLSYADISIIFFYVESTLV